MSNSFLKIFLVAISLSTVFQISAQQPQKPGSGDIYRSIQKLNFLGAVMYIAAHPDDENTKLISHLSNQVHARTAYLSLTRGDGGQNLIGPEIRELLGVIRTNELVQARRVDGGEQLFSRANDFGFSKVPDETFEIWDKDLVLSDVVWAIRNFQPDVIINRFDHRSPGTTHGHHTASAMLSLEAFDLVADKTKYPSQLSLAKTWQPKRVFFNTSWWFYGSQEKFDAADKSAMAEITTGIYDPKSGLSNSEIAALSRSRHQSQGFGSTGTRGTETEYLELLKGDMPKDKTNIFEGINTTWSRVKGGEAIGKILYKVETDFDFKNPAASIPALAQAYQLIEKLEDVHWKKVKSAEIKEIIAACAGLYLEVSTAENTATPGSKVMLNIEAVNRSSAAITLDKITVTGTSQTIGKTVSLKNNIKQTFKDSLNLPEDAAFTSAYWLNEQGSLGMYTVKEQELIGLPLTPAYNQLTFSLSIAGVKIAFDRPLVYKENDPVKGEVYKPFEVVPAIGLRMEKDVLICTSQEPKQVKVNIRAMQKDVQGELKLYVPDGWKVSPETQTFSIRQKGQESAVIFTVTPPAGSSEGMLYPIARVNEKLYERNIVHIDYGHIPYQTVLLPSAAKAVKLDIAKRGEKIAYVEGAGDVIPASLEQIGYKVSIIKPENISAENLAGFDALVMGVRAYNTIDALKFKQTEILKYVKNGGTVVVQYNTNGQLVTDSLAPYALQLSRDRVTDENAAVTFLAPEHPVLNTPNKITQKDFEGWEQERGLYFPSKWDPAFTAVLSAHDKNETPKDGGLLVAKYGKGYYIYTGYSWFREFPAGVPGAYRIFANMLSIGK